jgi:hypothetical protein
MFIVMGDDRHRVIRSAVSSTVQYEGVPKPRLDQVVDKGGQKTTTVTRGSQ